MSSTKGIDNGANNTMNKNMLQFVSEFKFLEKPNVSDTVRIPVKYTNSLFVDYPQNMLKNECRKRRIEHDMEELERLRDMLSRKQRFREYVNTSPVGKDGERLFVEGESITSGDLSVYEGSNVTRTGNFRVRSASKKTTLASYRGGYFVNLDSVHLQVEHHVTQHRLVNFSDRITSSAMLEDAVASNSLKALQILSKIKYDKFDLHSMGLPSNRTDD